MSQDEPKSAIWIQLQTRRSDLTSMQLNIAKGKRSGIQHPIRMQMSNNTTRMFQKDAAPKRIRLSGGIFCWLILALWCLCQTAHAALQFDVFLGYNGVVPEASWFPVVCEIKNDGAGFTGVIEISAVNFNNQDQTRRLTVELPTGTLKRVVIPVFSTARYQSSWDVRLVDGQGKVRAQQAGMRPTKQVGFSTTIMGALPRTASGVPVFRQIQGNQGELQPTSARLQTSIMPDNPLVFEGMDSLYLNSEKVSELSFTQVNALLAWLNGGGHLIVGVEQITDVNASPWLRKILPCDLTDVKNVDSHRELQQWLRRWSATTETAGGVSLSQLARPGRNRKSGGSPNSSVNPFADLTEDYVFEAAPLQVVVAKPRNGDVLVSIDDTPLMITSHQGQGRVTALLFSPEREPMRSWKNLPTFWTKLTEVSPALYTTEAFSQNGNSSVDGVFGAMIDSKQVRKLPVGWLLMLLIVYLLVIGPVDQMWLKRLKRPMLTWITFPCYVVLFSLLIYFIGYRLRAGETEWNELHVVDVLVNGEQAELRGRTYASIYSPVNATYKVESQQNYSTFRGEFMGGMYGSGGHDSEKADVMQNGDNFKAEIFVPVWTSQLYISDWWQTASLPLKVTVAPDGEGWKVTVDNRREKALSNAHLAVAGRMVELGELPAGKTKSYKIKKDQGLDLRDYVSRHASSFQSVIQQRHQAFGSTEGGRIHDLPNSTMAVSFISQLNQQAANREFIAPPGLDLTSVMEHGSAVVLAWDSDYSPVRPLNQFPTRRSNKDTLWRISVPVDSQP